MVYMLRGEPLLPVVVTFMFDTSRPAMRKVWPCNWVLLRGLISRGCGKARYIPQFWERPLLTKNNYVAAYIFNAWHVLLVLSCTCMHFASACSALQGEHNFLNAEAVVLKSERQLTKKSAKHLPCHLQGFNFLQVVDWFGWTLLTALLPKVGGQILDVLIRFSFDALRDA